MIDWYKIFELIVPSVVTGGTIVIGAYLGYFRKKFATYGDIDAKLEKLDKLEEIEKRLEAAKFEVQIERMDEILKIEKAKAIGKGSVDFEYTKRTNDSARLLKFSLKILDVTKAVADYRLVLTKNAISLYGELDNVNTKLERININVISRFEADNIMSNFLLVEQVRIEYGLYFKGYNSTKFDECYVEWLQQISLLGKSDSQYTKDIQFTLTKSINKLEAINKYQSLINERNDIKGTAEFDLYSSVYKFVDSLEHITNQIRQEG